MTKIENFRKAFKNFDFNKIAKFSQKDVDKLLKNEGIVRHKGKIEAVINNAKLARKIVEKDGSLASFFWSYEAKKNQKTKPTITLSCRGLLIHNLSYSTFLDHRTSCSEKGCIKNSPSHFVR